MAVNQRYDLLSTVLATSIAGTDVEEMEVAFVQYTEVSPLLDEVDWTFG